MKPQISWIILAGLVLLSACAAPPSNGKRAPVEERGLKTYSAPTGSYNFAQTNRSSTKSSNPVVQKNKNLSAENYVIQKGDTLFSIAFSHGLDYRVQSEENNIVDASLIKVGQQISLPSTTSAEKLEENRNVPPGATSAGSIKTEPRAEKIPYTDKAMAQSHAEMAQAKPLSNASVALDGEDESLDWGLPAKGPVVANFSEAANRKGIDIAGKLGTPVMASAAGKVVYSGSGLRGYGKLVIIKHNKIYLSAYAHNDQILVKEGQTVSKGQKIAEMGNSDSEQIKLHFEIRKLGKPVDPAQYLSAPKS